TRNLFRLLLLFLLFVCIVSLVEATKSKGGGSKKSNKSVKGLFKSGNGNSKGKSDHSGKGGPVIDLMKDKIAKEKSKSHGSDKIAKEKSKSHGSVIDLMKDKIAKEKSKSKSKIKSDLKPFKSKLISKHSKKPSKTSDIEEKSSKSSDDRTSETRQKPNKRPPVTNKQETIKRPPVTDRPETTFGPTVTDGPEQMELPPSTEGPGTRYIMTEPPMTTEDPDDEATTTETVSVSSPDGCKVGNATYEIGRSVFPTWSGLAGRSVFPTWSGLAGRSVFPTWSWLAGRSVFPTWSGLAGRSVFPTWSGLAGRSVFPTWSGLAGRAVFPTWRGLAGTFPHPSEKCHVCRCHVTGDVTCERRRCPRPPCGVGRHVTSSDGCCSVCESACKAVSCPAIACPSRLWLFDENSCCPKCGCRYKGDLVPMGPVGLRCDGCTCNGNGVTCSPAPCPATPLQCVDPVRDENSCQYYCPKGKTCSVGDFVLKYGEIVRLEDKYCTCVGDWFPVAFCAKVKMPCNIHDLQETMCVSEPQM
ncbi:hypothetical protein MAR_007612, partial [Mya arenaria]